jgi:tellurite methyltransferase
MKTLPDTVAPYQRTKTFTAETVPKGLLADHTTKAGVWGVITVTAGQLKYIIPSTGETTILEPGINGIAEPEVPHRVEPLGAVAFYVEFCR